MATELNEEDVNLDDDPADKDDDRDDDRDDDSLLGKGDEDKDDDKDDEDKEDKEDEDKEDEDEEGELKTGRVQYKELKGKYPDLFKDFPDLRHVFFREQKLTALYPTVKEAEIAKEAAEAYEEIREAVVSGDAEKFLEQLGDADSKGLKKFAGNFLPALREHSMELYTNITSPIITNILREVLSIGNSNGNKNIQNAAKLVHKVIFGGDHTDIEKEFRTKKDDEEDPDLKKDKEEYYGKKYNDLYTTVATEFTNTINAEIEKGIPKEGINPGTRKLAIKEIRERVAQQMGADQTHIARMNTYWNKEKRNGFSGTYKDSMLTTLLSRARSLVPKIRVEVKKELGLTSKTDDKQKLEVGSGSRTSVKPLSKAEAKGKSTRDVMFGA